MATTTAVPPPAPAVLPRGPSTPPILQAVYAMTTPHRGLPRLRARYGDAFTINLPAFGPSLVISAPAEIRQLFQTSPDVLDIPHRNLGRVLGDASLFALRDEAHRRQRKLLVPPFHGRRLAAYERIVEEEAVREFGRWPQDRPFPTLPSTMRITLDVILRAVFGARGAEFDELRELLPRMVTLGSRLAALPLPTVGRGPWSPWGRFRSMRRRYDAIVERMMVRAEGDGDLDGRDDILAMMLQSRYDDGSPMSHGEIADQLLTLLAAGHETTATTLAWAVERLRRHPRVLAGLVDEVDTGGGVLREATLIEVQRTRPVVDLVARQVRAEAIQLGRWTLPRGMVVLAGIGLAHNDDSIFPDAGSFDPARFLASVPAPRADPDGPAGPADPSPRPVRVLRPDLYQWIPFGGGTRRCLGAAFATMEMNVVLRTMLREVRLVPTADRAERWRSRGIANAPGKGGIAVVHRRAR